MIRNLNLNKGNEPCNQKSPKKHRILLKLLLGKATTGARVAKVKNSLFATAAIKAAALRQSSLKPVKPKRFISVVASSQRMAFCVMAAITLFEAFF
jgi:hypothetical protein